MNFETKQIKASAAKERNFKIKTFFEVSDFNNIQGPNSAESFSPKNFGHIGKFGNIGPELLPPPMYWLYILFKIS